jgi:hypothetical protein
MIATNYTLLSGSVAVQVWAGVVEAVVAAETLAAAAEAEVPIGT